MLHFSTVSPPFSWLHTLFPLLIHNSTYSILPTSGSIHTLLSSFLYFSSLFPHSLLHSILITIHYSAAMIFSLPFPISSCHTPYFIPCSKVNTVNTPCSIHGTLFSAPHPPPSHTVRHCAWFLSITHTLASTLHVHLCHAKYCSRVAYFILQSLLSVVHAITSIVFLSMCTILHSI